MKGDLQSHQRYIYQKILEIGSCDGDNVLQELRVLGLQTQADMGAAIAFELSGKTFVPLHDSLGNLIHVLDIKDGTILESFDYSAFAEESTQSTIPWRFASKRADPETGLVFFGHRYYNPSISRWLTPDPLHFTAGLNLYNYCKNNPLMYYDPDGRLLFMIAIPLAVWGAGSLTSITAFELGCIVGVAILGSMAAEGGRYLSEKASEEVPKEKKKEKKNTNPYAGPVDEDVMLVDSAGNVIPVKKGERASGSRNGEYLQVRDREGKPTGLRKDGPHNPIGNNDDPRHLKPHGHVPGVTNPDGTQWLPIYH